MCRPPVRTSRLSEHAVGKGDDGFSVRGRNDKRGGRVNASCRLADGGSEVVSAEVTDDRRQRSATASWEGFGWHSDLQVSRPVKWRLTQSPHGGVAKSVASTRGG